MSMKCLCKVDESNGIGDAQLLAFIRFVKVEKSVSEYLFCKDLHTTTKRKNIFDVVKENILLFKLQWKNCVSVCTADCLSIQGSRKGFVTSVL